MCPKTRAPICPPAPEPQRARADPGWPKGTPPWQVVWSDRRTPFGVMLTRQLSKRSPGASITRCDGSNTDVTVGLGLTRLEKQFAAPGTTPGIHGLRWWIAGLIFLATLIIFINRLTISVLAPVITEQLKLTNLEFASITNSFLIAYTASQALSGKLYDRVGNRRGFTISIVVWSFASMLHAFATGLFSLNCFRFLLGLGEAGNWPGAAKVIVEWFPIRQRALGMAIFNSGTSIGSVLAPPVIIALQLRFGWQTTFLAVGALGFLWLALWLAFYHSPAQHPRITPQELAPLREDRAPAAPPAGSPSWLPLFRSRQTWAIVLSRFCCDPVWWLYITWLPLYLYKVHGFSLKQVGLFAWVPYVAADAGSLFGGWMSGL